MFLSDGDLLMPKVEGRKLALQEEQLQPKVHCPPLQHKVQELTKDRISHGGARSTTRSNGLTSQPCCMGLCNA